MSYADAILGLIPGGQVLPDLYNKAMDYTKKWLSEDIDEEKYNTYIALNQIPGFSAWFARAIGQMSNEAYMARYGLTWDDIRNMHKLPGTGEISSSYRFAVNFVSDNIKRLYR